MTELGLKYILLFEYIWSYAMRPLVVYSWH